MTGGSESIVAPDGQSTYKRLVYIPWLPYQLRFRGAHRVGEYAGYFGEVDRNAAELVHTRALSLVILRQ